MKTKIYLLVSLIALLAIACKNNDVTTTSESDDMVLIPGGSFTSILEFDTLEVTIEPFLMDKHEITISKFDTFVNSTGYIPETDRPGAKPSVLVPPKIERVEGVTWRCDERGNVRDTSDYDYPVIFVSYEDAEAYAKWAGKRLPTIYEWQYAATAGAESQTVIKHIINDNWHAGNTKKVNRVGLKEPNHFGLYDIFGNVGEYVSIIEYGSYPLPPGLKLEDLSRSSFPSFFMDAAEMYPEVFSVGHRRATSFMDGFRCAKDVER